MHYNEGTIYYSWATHNQLVFCPSLHAEIGPLHAVAIRLTHPQTTLSQCIAVTAAVISDRLKLCFIPDTDLVV